MTTAPAPAGGVGADRRPSCLAAGGLRSVFLPAILYRSLRGDDRGRKRRNWSPLLDHNPERVKHGESGTDEIEDAPQLHRNAVKRVIFALLEFEELLLTCRGLPREKRTVIEPATAGPDQGARH
jgi:hypothetical protein